MALKPDRHLADTNITFYMNEVAERGGAVVLNTGGSGVALDPSVNVATYASNPSGRVVLGLLVSEVVNKDLTKTHLNYYKEEVQRGQKVTILQKGYLVTNMVYPGVNPLAGSGAYLHLSGYLTHLQTASTPLVGRFESSKDEDGYVKVSVNLP